jgi:hypothetical protein
MTLVCDYCGKELQTQEEANKQKEVWGDLPPEIRTKFESQYQIDQARFHRIIKYLRKTWLFHIILGAVLLSGISLWAATFWVIDIVYGAIAGWLINRYQGGMFNGMFIMLGAYVISLMTKFTFNPVPLGDVATRYLLGYGGITGGATSLAAGFLFGLYVEQDLERYVQ